MKNQQESKQWLMGTCMALAAWAGATTSALGQDQYFRFAGATNPQGVEMKIDSHGIRIGDKAQIPVMGEMHYSRVPRADWHRELSKMKAGGVTIVATYIFWNHHEAEEGHWDWSGNRDLREFVKECARVGLMVVLRVGPWCHGEVYLGGLPDWIVERSKSNKEYKPRTMAPQFMAKTEVLFNNIGGQVRGLLWKDGGPIVGVQIENESRGPWPYLAKLKEMALKAGLEVPMMTRTGWPKMNGTAEFGELLPLYGDYADGFWDRALTDMPGSYTDAFKFKSSRLSAVIATEALGKQSTEMDKGDLSYPYLTCELGGGMMPSYHRRINISGREMMPLAICKIGSGSNLPGYYMYHGGTNPYNPAHTMAETQASDFTNYNDLPHITYDFQAPLGEMGQLNETSFHQSRWLHQFLADWGEELSQMDVDTLNDHYARRGQFEFRCDYVRIKNEKGVACVTPKEMKWKDLSISSEGVQPFAKADGGLYFIGVAGQKPVVTVGGKKTTLVPDHAVEVQGHQLTLLSEAKARTAFVIDGQMHYAKHGGVLYKDGDKVCEEWWERKSAKGIAKHSTMREATKDREIALGSQKAAAQPTEAEWAKAAEWSVEIDTTKVGAPVADSFLKITYHGDVARVWADGILVQDNFWNGKPMLVRLSDLAGKKVTLQVLPMPKNDKIYLQKAQKAEVDRSQNYMISVDNMEIMVRHTDAM